MISRSGKFFLVFLGITAVIAGMLIGSVLESRKGSSASAPPSTASPAPAPLAARPTPLPSPTSAPPPAPTRAPTTRPAAATSTRPAAPSPTPAVVIKPEGADALFVAILIPAPRYRAGEKATLEAQTMPNAQLSIAVYYGSQVVRAEGLEAKAADRTGRVSWTWTVPPGTRGPGRAVVVATQQGRAQTAETTFTVE